MTTQIMLQRALSAGGRVQPLAHAADELDLLPAGSATEQMLADYQVMREQARACL